MKTVHENCGWWATGWAVYKSSEAFEYPGTDKTDDWYEFLDGFMAAYADYSIDDNTTFLKELESRLKGVYFLIEPMIEEWKNQERKGFVRQQWP